LSAVRRKKKPKKPLGPRKALEAMALRMAAKIMARQRERGAFAPAGSTVVFDDATGWADVPRYTSPERESKRRFV
jgi:hypothetical protein